jgi:hypothetical protein
MRNYIDLLGRIHRQLAPKTYVEIGVSRGRSFRQVLPETLAVGIDPTLSMLQPVNRAANVFALESDEFFEKKDLRAVLNGRPVDLAFIDGMHLFEFALRTRFGVGKTTSIPWSSSILESDGWFSQTDGCGPRPVACRSPRSTPELRH